MIKFQVPILKSLRGQASRVSLLSRRFSKDDRGIAAIEFAIIAPVMIGMYFGLAEIASAISVDRRVSHSTNVIGDLATQQPELKDNDIAEVISAALRVMGIRDASDVSIDMESFIKPTAAGAPESQGRIRLNQSTGVLTAFDATTLDEKLLNDKSGVTYSFGACSCGNTIFNPIETPPASCAPRLPASITPGPPPVTMIFSCPPVASDLSVMMRANFRASS